MKVNASVPDSKFRQNRAWTIIGRDDIGYIVESGDEEDVIRGLTHEAAQGIVDAYRTFMETVTGALNESYDTLHDPERWTVEDYAGLFYAQSGSKRGEGFNTPKAAALFLFDKFANVQTCDVVAVATGRVRESLFERL